MGTAAFGSSRWSLALQEAFYWHQGQTRKHSGLPYVIHCIEVAQVLERLGFDESVLITALLHDTLEDTAIPPNRISQLFGEEILGHLYLLSETKRDPAGHKRPWLARKRDHIKVLSGAPVPVRAVALADQWHNLVSILSDWATDDPLFWQAFNAPAADVVNYHRLRAAACYHGERGLKPLADIVLKELEVLSSRVCAEQPDEPTKFSSRDWAC